MHLAIDIRHLATDQHSGVGRYTLELLRRMPKLAPNDNFTFFASGSEETLNKLPKFSGSNIQIIKQQIPNRVLSAKLFFTAHTLDDFLPKKPDLWFFPNINIIKTHKPYVITVHDLSFEMFPHFFTLKDRLWHKASSPKSLINDSESILAVSENTKHNLCSLWGVSEDKISTTPLGVDDDFDSAEQPCDQNFLREYGIDYSYILSLCTLEPRKNIETTVEAYEKWRDFYSQDIDSSSIPHLIIAGGRGWKNSYLHKRISSSPYRNQIHLLGYIPEKHKPTLYRHASLFVFPSFFEGFGLPIVEALASGTTVISSFTGSMQEVGKEHVIYIDPYNVNDLTHAIQIGLEQQEEAFELPSNIFSWDSTARRTLGVLKACCGE